MNEKLLAVAKFFRANGIWVFLVVFTLAAGTIFFYSHETSGPEAPLPRGWSKAPDAGR